MRGVRFEPASPVVRPAPDRADVACFVGFVARRDTPVPADVRRWLVEQGWIGGPSAYPPTRIDELLDVPVPLHSWDAFDRLFAWEARAGADGRTYGTYVGAAVRSFFAQGGRTCYLVRVGDPWPFGSPRRARGGVMDLLLPGLSGRGAEPSPAARRTWSGAAHLYGLPDVSFLALPDLADAASADPEPMLPIEAPPPPPARFVECAEEPADLRETESVLRLRAPRCDEEGFDAWAAAVRYAGGMLRRRAREVQLVAGLPLPDSRLRVPGTSTTSYLAPPGLSPAGEPAEEAAAGREYTAGDSLLRFLVDGGWLRGALGEDATSIASAFVQLAYPWLRTPGAARLPGQVEGPEGALVGMLARNALMRGTFRSAGNLHTGDVTGVYPVVRREQLVRPLRDGSGRSGPPRALPERISLFGPTPLGPRLLSDVTTSREEGYRPAGVNRLVASIVRAARRLGEDSTFENSGEALWRRVEERIGQLLLGLLRDGALRGASAVEAFEVRCDRSTMTQNDLDSGRVVAHVTLRPAAPVEEIVVVLALQNGGGASAREAA